MARARTVIGKLEDGFIYCRARGRHTRMVEIHDTSPESSRKYSSRSAISLVSRCEICGTERREVWSRVTGEILAVAYKHPAGYRLSRNVAADRRLFRREQIDRWDAAASLTARSRRRPATTRQRAAA